MDYKALDPELWGAIEQEAERQEQNIELIASENIVSEAVRMAQGSVLTNKYAEGYPGRRYYGGCEFVDCECTGTFWFTSESSSLFLIDSAWRYCFRNGSFSRRSLDSWFTSKCQRQAVQFCQLRCRSSYRNDRL